MAKKKEQPKEEVKEEKTEKAETKKTGEKPEEKDYNSIFDDDYVEEKVKAREDDEDDDTDGEEGEAKEEESAEEPIEDEEEAERENTEVAEDEEEDEEPKEEVKQEAPEKKTVKKTKKTKEFPTKKVLIISVAVFLLLLGGFLGYMLFKSQNKPKEEPKVETTTSEPAKESEKKPEKVVYVDSDSGLNLREDASSSSKSLGIIPNGTKLTVLEEKDGWYKVEYNGQEGWVSEEFVTETKPPEWKTYSGTGYSPDNPKFSINYPADWTLDDYNVSKTDNGKEYKITLGAGGHGIGEGDDTVTTTNEDVTVNGVSGRKTIAKRDGKIFLIITGFTKGDYYINIEFSVPEGYDESYIEKYNEMVKSFKFI